MSSWSRPARALVPATVLAMAVTVVAAPAEAGRRADTWGVPVKATITLTATATATVTGCRSTARRGPPGRG